MQAAELNYGNSTHMYRLYNIPERMWATESNYGYTNAHVQIIQHPRTNAGH